MVIWWPLSKDYQFPNLKIPFLLLYLNLPDFHRHHLFAFWYLNVLILIASVFVLVDFVFVILDHTQGLLDQISDPEVVKHLNMAGMLVYRQLL